MTYIFNARWVGYTVAQIVKSIVVGVFWRLSEKAYYEMKRRGWAK